MAPEVISHESYSRPADVFSFAMLLLELLTHQSPFADLSPVLAATAIALERKRPALPAGTPPSLAQLIACGWATEPATRPTFDAIGTQLASIEASVSAEEREWLDAERGHPVQLPAAALVSANRTPADHARTTGAEQKKRPRDGTV